MLRTVQVFTLLLLLSISFYCSASGALSVAQNVQQTDNATSTAAVKEASYEYKDSLFRDTPRGTLAGLFEAAFEQNYDKAAKYLDLRYLPDDMDAELGPEYAKQLIAIIERNIWVNMQEINDTPDGTSEDQLPSYRDAFGRVQIKGSEITLLLQKVPNKQLGSIWKVSNATVAKVPLLYSELGYGPVVEWFVKHIPQGHLFKLNLWEWALLICYFVLAMLVVIPVTWIAKKFILRSEYQYKADVAHLVVGPFRFLVALLLVRAWMAHTTLSANVIAVVNTGVLLLIAVVWFIWSVTDVIQNSLRLRWISRGNSQSASLLRPLANFIRVILVALAVLIWLEHLGFDASTILAGLGIGGIAVALASKQSIENFIGTLTLYSSAPIKVGNVGRFGTITGTVEEIGLRCTRIRTIDRSVINVPNARLSEMDIENISEREKIRLKTDIRLDYQTNTEQIHAIINDIRALLEQHEKVEESPLRVTFKGFGLYGLQLNVFAYIGTTDFAEFQLVSEELHFGIMNVVTKHGSRIVPVVPVAAAQQ
ncbi:mechanosensitive ion channel family protein [Shewanella pneumatophori]|uniref:Mechanosensitive ion channel family protein n=1 Tax=Shewanella pneumatophori TaxID=314092 RepID=A0A9X2CG63_9GAMM|nr:mechanosensitive ion channel family protein [Shewanella pneumatophori]MCL1137105.1 mechanosensitive ion channel family protein [Shewanella pneumatophori]